MNVRNKLKGQRVKNDKNVYIDRIDSGNDINSYGQVTLGEIDKNGYVIGSSRQNDDIQNVRQNKLMRQSNKTLSSEQEQHILQRYMSRIQQTIGGELSRKRIQRQLTIQEQRMLQRISKDSRFCEIVQGMMVIQTCAQQLVRQGMQRLVSLIRSVNLVIVSVKLLWVDNNNYIQTASTSTDRDRDNYKYKEIVNSRVNDGVDIDIRDRQYISRFPQSSVRQSRLVKLLDSVKFMAMVIKNTQKYQHKQNQQSLLLEKQRQQLENKTNNQYQVNIQQLRSMIEYQIQKMQLLLSFQQPNTNTTFQQPNTNTNTTNQYNQQIDQSISIKSLEQRLIQMHNQQQQIMLSQLQKENVFLKHQIYLKQNTITEYQQSIYDIDLSEYKHNQQRESYCLINQREQHCLINQESNINCRSSDNNNNSRGFIKTNRNTQTNRVSMKNDNNNNRHKSLLNERVKFIPSSSYIIMNENDQILSQPSLINTHNNINDVKFNQEQNILSDQQQRQHNQELSHYLSIISRKIQQLQTQNKLLKCSIQEMYRQRERERQQQRQRQKLTIDNKNDDIIVQRSIQQQQIENSGSVQSMRLQQLLRQIQQMKLKVKQLQQKQHNNIDQNKQREQLIVELHKIVTKLQQEVDSYNRSISLLNLQIEDKLNQINTYKEQIESHKEQIKSHKEQVERYKEQVIDLEQKLKRVYQQNQQCRQEIYNFKQLNQQLNSQIYQLIQQNDKLIEQNQKLTQQNERLIRQKDKLIEQNERLIKQRDQLKQQQMNKLTQQVNILNEHKSELLKQIVKKQTYIQYLNKDICNMNIEFSVSIQKYNTVFYQINNQLQQSNTANKRLNQSILELNQSIYDLNEQINTLKQQNNKLVKYNKLLQQQNLKYQSVLLNIHTNLYSTQNILNITPKQQLQPIKSIRSTPNLNHSPTLLSKNLSDNQIQKLTPTKLNTNRIKEYSSQQSLTPKKLCIKINNSKISTKIIPQNQTNTENLSITQSNNLIKFNQSKYKGQQILNHNNQILNHNNKQQNYLPQINQFSPQFN